MGGRRRYRVLRLARAAVSGKFKILFSQFGEDALVYRHFPKGFVGTYLDIGAYHPFKFSNTARLWTMGWNGVNVDANKSSVALFDRIRPNDVNIWAAVVPQMERDRSETVAFSAGDGISAIGHIVDLGTAGPQVPAISLKDLCRHFQRPVDFMNIDIEGLDEAIIGDEAFRALAPRLLAIVQYGEDLAEILRRPSTALLTDLGYSLVSRCELTSLFLRKDVSPTTPARALP